MIGVVGEELTLHSARAMGTAMSRIAEAEIALMRSQVEAPMNRSEVAVASILTRYRIMVEQFLPATAQGMDALHRATWSASGSATVAGRARPTSTTSSTWWSALPT